MKMIEEHRCFGGIQRVYEHISSVTQCTMRFGLFLPPSPGNQKMPVLYWLSGLTCTEQNFITKAGAQRFAAEYGIILVTPDTSPRGITLPGDREHFDFGVSAGFYVDATEEPWEQHYRMYSYIQQELPAIVEQIAPVNQQACGIFGHSMGGHGALILALNNPHQYHSVSAFAPICSPSNSPWGEKAFSGYLGKDTSLWKQYDACELIIKKGWPHGAILIDQGSDDPWLSEQLKPDLLEVAAMKAGVPVTVRMQGGYDHSYYFVSSFMEEHMRFHASNLGLLK